MTHISAQGQEKHPLCREVQVVCKKFANMATDCVATTMVSQMLLMPRSRVGRPYVTRGRREGTVPKTYL